MLERKQLPGTLRRSLPRLDEPDRAVSTASWRRFAPEAARGWLTRRRLIFAGLQLIFFQLLMATLTVGQTGQDETIRVETDLVTLNITVSTPRDRPGTRQQALPILGARNFTVFEDGVKQRISAFSSANEPFNLVLLIDTSGSTREDIDLIRNGARRFFDAMRADDRMAIVQFSREVELLRDLTSDRTELEEGLSLLERGTGTSFYDAIHLTVSDVLGKVRGRKVIIALTDGVDSFGHLTWEEIQPLVEQTGATIHILQLDTELFTSNGVRKDCQQPTRFELSAKQLRKYYDEYVKDGPRSIYHSHCRLKETERVAINRLLYQSARRELGQIAQLTGGMVHEIGRLSQLEEAYLRIAQTLRNVYSISYYPTNDRHDAGWRTLRVEVRPDNGPSLAASTRPGYRTRSPRSR